MNHSIPFLRGGCDDLYRKCCDSPIFISENARTIAVEHWAKSPDDTIVFVPVDSLHAILGGGFDFTRLNQAGITGSCVASHGDGRKILVFRADFVGNTRPTEGGVYVQVSKYANGSVKSTKVLVK